MADPTDLGLDVWRSLAAAQQPKEVADATAVRSVAATLADLPPLVVSSEVDQLRERLADVARGEAFLLQGGDCAETFATSSPAGVAGKVRMLLQMAIVLTWGASCRWSSSAGSPGSTRSPVRHLDGPAGCRIAATWSTTCSATARRIRNACCVHTRPRRRR